jgi:hypothetical protein
MILEDVLFKIIKQARADKDAKIAALKLEVESIEDILDARHDQEKAYISENVIRNLKFACKRNSKTFQR